MSDKTKTYYNTGSLDEYSKSIRRNPITALTHPPPALSENRKTFNKCRFVPRVMVDVSAVYPQTKIFGQDSPLPIYISPASNALLGHPDGEFTLVRGAAKTGIFQGISAASSLPLHELLEEKDRLDDELGGRMNMGYQVYIQSEREKSEAQVREAVEGGVKALFLTVDTPVLGHRQKVSFKKQFTGGTDEASTERESQGYYGRLLSRDSNESAYRLPTIP
jgi:L-lactate dehydrogenase (cytochrome)